MMHSFPSSDRFPSFSTNFAVNTTACLSEMHVEVDNESSEGSTVITNTANEATESTTGMSGTVVNDSADDDVVAKKRIDIFESTFPHKLYHILQNPDFKDIITWMPNGRSWKMIDRKEFTKRVLPLFFRHQKFSSFKRQLSGWEFLRGVKECSANEYHHPVRKHCLILFFHVTNISVNTFLTF
jgi:HSF-type DNA-binding